MSRISIRTNLKYLCKKAFAYVLLFVIVISTTMINFGISVKAEESDFIFTPNSDGRTCTLSQYRGNQSKVEIPSTAVIDGKTYVVTEIGHDAFWFNINLISVNIPKSIIKIGEEAFLSCTKLNELNVPDGVEEIENGAFAFCTNLKKVVIPGSVIKMGLEPAGEFRYEHTVFLGCDNLLELVIDEENPIYSSDFQGCIYDKDKTKLLVGNPAAKQIVVPNTVTEIEAFAFSMNNNLTTITLSNGKINGHAFSVCEALMRVFISESVTEIVPCAFSSCNNLYTITVDVKNKVYSSDSQGCLYNKDKSVLMFGNPARESVIIPDTVKEIGNEAFFGCNITSIVVPKTIEKIGKAIFELCDKLTNISVVSDSPYFSSDSQGCIYNKEKSELICGNPTASNIKLPATLVQIDECAFSNYSKLIEVEIPDGVKIIGEGAFMGCDMMENLVLPSSVERIGGIAFSYCDKLSSVTIPKKVIVIEQGLFLGCSNLSKVELLGNITSIRELAFWGCTKLNNISIPSSIKEIGSEAFLGVSNHFVIQGYSGTVAETYAEDNGITFQSLGKVDNNDVPEEGNLLPGDINLDKKVTSVDALLALKMTLSNDESWTMEQRKNAKVTTDEGDVTIKDVLMILKYSSGEIDDFSK